MIVRQLLSFLTRRERFQALGLLGLMAVGAVWEAASLAAIMGFIGLLSGRFPDAAQRWPLSWAATLPHDTLLYGAGAALFLIIAGKNLYLRTFYRMQYRFLYARQFALSTRLFEGFLHSPYLFHVYRNSGELLRRVNSDVLSVYHNVAMPLLTLLAEAMIVGLVVVLLAVADPVSTLVVAATVGVLSWLFFASVRKQVAAGGREQHHHEGQMVRWVNHGLGSIKEVKVSGREAFFAAAYAESAMRFKDAMRYLQTVQQLPRLFIETVSVSALVLVVTIAIARGRDMQTLLPTVALFATAGYRLIPSMGRIVSTTTMIRHFVPAVQAVADDLAAVSAAGATRADSSDPANGPMPPCRIELSHVSYQYPGAAQPALSDVTLQIEPGSAVAFVGPSGAGKSTLVDVILGLLPPTSGAVLLGGKDMHRHLPSWRRSLGYVPQTIYLGDDNIRRNVAFGLSDREINDDAVWAALEGAQLAEYVRAQPAGLDTLVGERGVRISGGERQRLGIARALYHQPSVLVLDEATSALDQATERSILQLIAGLKGARTIISVTHRLSATDYCDSICLLRSGKLTRIVSHSELIAEQG